jgi:hypothetical protein
MREWAADSGMKDRIDDGKKRLRVSMNVLRKMSILVMPLSGLMLLLLGAAFGQTQTDMNQAADKAEHRADVEMTARYNKLKTVLTPGQKVRLQEVQRA